ncbi:S-layer homology domain-containing protein [Paenibacillus thalictri]|uniref:S-layer homology domain-containing protein n=1 Tax=Paenibacillus thalictri TaxID=2527873 RepID=A0A4Q9DIG2_9BACL|nr:S-layer homology domain-containing protein [Paenibacillus thalictri]TBL72979.1 S-layer homology domain-containing protein [Paenibacillus thalictri]
MKRFSRKWISAAIIMSMLISLLPPLSAFAAAQLMITNISYVNADAPDSSKTVDRLTVNPSTLNVTINGFTEDQINNIYYEIVNINTGKISTEKTNKPVKSSSNNNEITFTNISYTEGLNKVTVKYGDTSIISSLPGWVYFTPVSNITDLQFNGAPFLDDLMYPTAPPYTSLSITGTAGNASQIQATVNGTVYNPSVFNRGRFSYYVNTGRPNDLNFTPGDNEIMFIARNGTNYYTIKKSFVYNNGKSFAYNAYIKQVEDIKPAAKLATIPTVSNDTAATPPHWSTNVAITAKLKNNFTGGVRDYESVDIFTLGKGQDFVANYNFNTGVITETNNTTTIIPDPSTGRVSTAVYDSASSTTAFEVYDFTTQLPTNTGTKFQQVVFQFKKHNGDSLTSVYSYYFQDNAQAYVDHVAKVVNPLAQPAQQAEVNLSDLGKTQINELPAVLKVYTNENAQFVKVKLNGSAYNDGVTVDRDANNEPIYQVQSTTNAAGDPIYFAQVSIQGIQDGDATLQVIPYKPDGSGTQIANPAGQKSYSIVISGAPYIILSNLYNGMVVNNELKISCTVAPAAPDGPCITGRVVNLPVAEYGNVQLSVNNQIVQDTNGKNPFDSTLPYIVTTADASQGSFTIPSAMLSGFFTNDGKKTIRFDIYIGGKLVTQTSYDIFVLTDDVPLVNSFIPKETGTTTKFVAGSKADTYSTNETSVQLVGDMANSDVLNGTATVRYRKTGDINFTTISPTVGLPPNTGYESVQQSGATPPFTETFTTNPITLDQYGDYTFEVTARNSSGLVVTRSLVITREPQPYTVLSPPLIKNSDGKDQANINQNFQKIRIRADKADSVLVGKELAVKEASTAATLNQDIFAYELIGLKAGKNEIKFTIVRGKDKLSGSFILNYVNTPIEGAQEKQKLQSKMKVFDGDIEISFPKDTKLMKNDRSLADQYLTTDRQILFGIARNEDGMVDKYLEGGLNINTNPPTDQTARNFLAEPTGRFIPASKRYWIDAGIIPAPTSTLNFSLEDALRGSGTLPLNPTDSTTRLFVRNITDLVVPNKIGTITLKFDGAIRDDAWKYVTVYQYGIFNEYSGGGKQVAEWRNIGGVIDLKKNTITVPLKSFGYFQVMYMNDSFNDVTDHKYARDSMDTLYSKGIMKSKDPGLFYPTDAVTRGEFVTMLVDIFDIPLENEDTKTRTTDQNDPAYMGTFDDVRRDRTLTGSNGLYDFLHIEAAARAGIVRGTASGLFLPAEAITRQDAAVMIARAADLKVESDPAKALTPLQKSFTDASLINAYSRGSVSAIVKAGLIEGVENALLQGQTKKTYRFDPLENMSRADASIIAMRVLKQQKKVPK